MQSVQILIEVSVWQVLPEGCDKLCSPAASLKHGLQHPQMPLAHLGRPPSTRTHVPIRARALPTARQAVIIAAGLMLYAA